MSSRMEATPHGRTAVAVLLTLSACHLLNDLLQSLLPAIYPMLKSGFGSTTGRSG